MSAIYFVIRLAIAVVVAIVPLMTCYSEGLVMAEVNRNELFGQWYFRELSWIKDVESKYTLVDHCDLDLLRSK